MFLPSYVLSGRRVLLRHILHLIFLTVIPLESVDVAAAIPPPTEPPVGTLLALAKTKFGALSRAEEELFRAAQEGRTASALTGNKKEDNPASAANWNADRVVRAKCISWVCTDPQASALVSYRGLELHGMRVDGSVELDNAEIKFALRAWNCAFSGHISLQDAQLRVLYLLGCQIRSLNARRATTKGSVFLSKGFKAEGEVNLVETRIGGRLDCSGAQFLNANGIALTANGAQIEGGVFLRNGFKAEGEVNLVKATIGGHLDCVGGAQFLNAKGMALNANTANIEGCVYLRDGFKAEGAVNLVAATIGNLQIHNIVRADQMILDLRLTKTGTFWDDEKSWPKAGNLFLDGFRYERLDENAPVQADSRRKWLSLQRSDRFRPQPYEQLAAVLRQMGNEREARQVMILKNHERARFTEFPHQSWWWYNVFGRLISYGYAPWRAFAMSLAMILLGTLLFHFGSAHDLISPTSENAYVKEPNGQVSEENKRPKISEKYPVFNAFFYSLESFVPLLKLDQSANWRPNANHGTEISPFHFSVARTGSLLRYYLYFHIASGWLLTSLWVGAVTGLVKT
jgi:sRNA-binding regulator protein Hfq